jgi:intein-encoded DNA endonuclease-like protein
MLFIARIIIGKYINKYLCVFTSSKRAPTKPPPNNEFVNKTYPREVVKLDVDDKKQYDSYYRILVVVYVNGTNLNEKMVKEGYAEVMYIPPSEFDSREWDADYT